MIDYIGNARTQRKAIETAVPSLDDKMASTSPSLFPRLVGGGALVKAGTRINWNGILKRAASDLWDTAENNPDNAPTLWEDIAYREGYRIIPDYVEFWQGRASRLHDRIAFSRKEDSTWSKERLAP